MDEKDGFTQEDEDPFYLKSEKEKREDDRLTKITNLDDLLLSFGLSYGGY